MCLCILFYQTMYMYKIGAFPGTLNQMFIFCILLWCIGCSAGPICKEANLGGGGGGRLMALNRVG